MFHAPSARLATALRQLDFLNTLRSDSKHSANKEVIESLLATMENELRRCKSATIPHVIPHPRSGLPFDKDRKYGTVVCNDRYYLPLPRHDCLKKVGRLNNVFPRVLLLGDLFSSVTPVDAEEKSLWKVQNTYAKYFVQTQGPELRTIDRRVMCAILTYAACENFAFSKDAPDAASITCTLNYLIEHILGCPDSAERRAAIVSSLLRLSETSVKVKERGQDLVTLPSMIRLLATPKESRKLHLQIPMEWVYLFKQGNWTTVHADIAQLDDLTGWLAYFYACHSQPHAIDVATLKILCGRQHQRSNQFSAALKEALDRLSSPSLPPDVRISSFHPTYEGRTLRTIEVSLVAWDKRSKAKRPGV